VGPCINPAYHLLLPLEVASIVVDAFRRIRLPLANWRTSEGFCSGGIRLMVLTIRFAPAMAQLPRLTNALPDLFSMNGRFRRGYDAQPDLLPVYTDYANGHAKVRQDDFFAHLASEYKHRNNSFLYSTRSWNQAVSLPLLASVDSRLWIGGSPRRNRLLPLRDAKIETMARFNSERS
jgi:hypothetical protein